MDNTSDRLLRIRLAGLAESEHLVPADAFLRASTGITGFLRQVAKDVGVGKLIEWRMGPVERGSVQMSIVGSPVHEDYRSEATEVVSRAFRGIRQLENGSNPSSFLSAKAIDKLDSFLSASQANHGGMSIAYQDHVIDVSENSINAVREFLKRKYRSIGSAEGFLETISVHDARPNFTIFHVLDGYAIRCTSSSELIEEAKKSLGVRVRVSGYVQKSAIGRVESIDAMRIKTLSNRKEVPTVGAMIGIFNEDADPYNKDKQ